MVMLGMNNINHYINDVINGHNKTYDELEYRLKILVKKNTITNWLIILLLIIVIAEFIIFFNP